MNWKILMASKNKGADSWVLSMHRNLFVNLGYHFEIIGWKVKMISLCSFDLTNG